MMLLRSFASRWGILAVCLLCSAAVEARGQGRVLTPGNPPLTSEMTDKTAGFFEWALDIQLTPAQREEYEQMMIRDWADPARRKSTVGLIPMIDKVAASPTETRERLQAALRRELLDGLRKGSQDGEARWMLAIYDAAHTSPVTPPLIATSDVVVPARFTGKWRSTSAAAVQYKDSYTGSLAPTSGHSFAYEFLPDGTYRSSNLLQVTTYGCTSSVYNENSGRYRVEADRLYIEPSGGFVRSHVCGGQPSEKPDKLEVREYVFHFESNGGRDLLVINGVDGKTRPDYFRREQ